MLLIIPDWEIKLIGSVEYQKAMLVVAEGPILKKLIFHYELMRKLGILACRKLMIPDGRLKLLGPVGPLRLYAPCNYRAFRLKFDTLWYTKMTEGNWAIEGS